MEVDYLWGQVLNISEPPTPVAARKKKIWQTQTEDTGRNIWKPSTLSMSVIEKESLNGGTLRDRETLPWEAVGVAKWKS